MEHLGFQMDHLPNWNQRLVSKQKIVKWSETFMRIKNYWFRYMKTKTVVWKSIEQKCCILIPLKGKTFQVSLDKDMQKAIIFILPQLFDDHIIKIINEELPISFPNNL